MHRHYSDKVFFLLISMGIIVFLYSDILYQKLLDFSDHGTQYTTSAFRQLLDSLHVVQSFSKKGYPFDSACCECFFKYLKKKKTTENAPLLWKNCSFLSLSILKDTTVRKDYILALACLLPTKRRPYTGSRRFRLLLENFILFCIYLLT